MAGSGEKDVTKNIIFLVIITIEFYDWNYLEEGTVCSTNSLNHSWEKLTSPFLYLCRISPSCFDPWFVLVFSPSKNNVCVLFLSRLVYFCKYITKHDPCNLTFRFQTPLCMVLFYLTVVKTFGISRYNWHLRKGSSLYQITPTFSLSILQCRLNFRCFLKLFPDCKYCYE